MDAPDYTRQREAGEIPTPATDATPLSELWSDAMPDDNMIHHPDIGPVDRDEERTVTIDCNWRPNGGTYVTKAMQAARDADAAEARKIKMQKPVHRRDTRFRK